MQRRGERPRFSCWTMAICTEYLAASRASGMSWSDYVGTRRKRVKRTFQLGSSMDNNAMRFDFAADRGPSELQIATGICARA